MSDFYDLVKITLNHQPESTRRLAKISFLKKWNADPNIQLCCESAPIRIEGRAFYRNYGDRHSLQAIFASAKRLDREVAFAGILVGGRIVQFIRGMTGFRGFCSWDAGSLMKRARLAAEKWNGEILLGHTHPASYGAICSNIYWTKRALQKFGDPNSLEMLKTGLYKEFGGDYAEMLLRSKMPGMSKYFTILSPCEDQIGIFEICEDGLMAYHPWFVSTP